MKVYLDNCCYNRPYDDQSQLRISFETQAKLKIQEMIRDGAIELASSYVLMYENSKNPHQLRQNTIKRFVNDNISTYIDVDCADEVKELARTIMSTGVKTADAQHVACAILAESDFFISTDDRLLKYQSDEIRIMDPISFIMEMEVTS